MDKLKNRKTIFIIILVISCVSGCGPENSSPENILDPEETYLVLFEKDHYSRGYSELDFGFTNSIQMKNLFESLGVPEKNIISVRDTLTVGELRQAITHVHEIAPENATVLFYIAAHGRYLRDQVKWSRTFPPLWESLNQRNKILIIDSCFAAEFIQPFEDDQASGIFCGVVSDDELNWWSEECENLPVVGSIWVHYFVEGIRTRAADMNDDRALSFSEAHLYTNGQVQEYMARHIFSNSEYLSVYRELGFDPLEEEAYPNAVMYNRLEHDLILNAWD